MKFVSSVILAGAAFALAACGHDDMEDTMMSGDDMMAPEIRAGFDEAIPVYFGFDSIEISTLGQSAIDQAVGLSLGEDASAITIIGHTDTMGTTAYNQALSERRAAVVSNAMEIGGVDGDIITAFGLGERVLAVETGDQVRNAQNRRAEITLAD